MIFKPNLQQQKESESGDFKFKIYLIYVVMNKTKCESTSFKVEFWECLIVEFSIGNNLLQICKLWFLK